MRDHVVFKVMTFNVRFDNPQDGLHAWSFRKGLVARTVLDEAPDLLGTQECTKAQLAFLVENLKGYRPCTPQRVPDDDPGVQMPTIFYKVQHWVPRERGEFWLSDTPGVYRSKSWGAAFPRLLTYAKFYHLPGGVSLWFANTHLDHVSAEARRKAACMIKDWVMAKRLPVVLVGDFNEGPGGDVQAILTRGRRGLKDAWSPLRYLEGDSTPTVHHFTGIGEGERIDWILMSPELEVLEAHLVTRSDGLPSDHFPCVATLRLA